MKSVWQSKKIIVIGSGTLVVLIGLTALVLFLISSRSNHRFIVTHIAQTGPQKEALPTDYLATFLGLKAREKAAFSRITLRQAEQQLLAHPVIETAMLSKQEESVLLVDYTLRAPVAFLGDISNLALDAYGYCFPFFPFFTPKKMPTFYFGLDEQIVAPLQGEKVDLAFATLSFLEETLQHTDAFLESIDVAQATCPNLGKREMIVTIITKSGKHYLRLTPTRYEEEINRYLLIRHQWDGDRTFDLRLERLAFVK